MRKLPAVLGVAALSALTLAGCSTAPAAGCDRPAASGSSLADLVTVDGTVGSEPDVELYTPFNVSETSWSDVEVGDGVPITTPGQVAVLDISLFSGETGELLAQTPYGDDLAAYEANGPLPGLETAWYTALPALEDALECATGGSRVVVGLAPGDVAPETAAGVGLGDDESAIAVVDVRKAFLPRATGALQFNAGFSLPSVVRAADGRPGVIVPDAAPPSDVVVETLVRGDGPEVTGDVPVRVHYTGVLWDDKSVFDTSWDGAPASFSLEDVVPGFAAGLEGQTVGSQVLIVVPPDQGYGEEGQGSIPPDSTLVFVVDILGLDELG